MKQLYFRKVPVHYFESPFEDRTKFPESDRTEFPEPAVANTEQGHDRLLIGYAAIIPRAFGQRGVASHHIYRLRPRGNSRLTGTFLCHLLNSRQMHDIVSGYANGTTVNMLPIDGVQTPAILVPPHPLVAAFDRLVAKIEARREEAVVESRSLAALRDTLLPKLISGELRIAARCGACSHA